MTVFFVWCWYNCIVLGINLIDWTHHLRRTFWFFHSLANIIFFTFSWSSIAEEFLKFLIVWSQNQVFCVFSFLSCEWNRHDLFEQHASTSTNLNVSKSVEFKELWRPRRVEKWWWFGILEHVCRIYNGKILLFVFLFHDEFIFFCSSLFWSKSFRPYSSFFFLCSQTSSWHLPYFILGFKDSSCQYSNVCVKDSIDVNFDHLCDILTTEMALASILQELDTTFIA